MTKVVKFGPALVLALLVTLLLGGWSTWSYGLRCANCAVGAQLLEQRFLGAAILAHRSERQPGEILSVFWSAVASMLSVEKALAERPIFCWGAMVVLRDHVRGGALRPRIVAVQALLPNYPRQ